MSTHSVALVRFSFVGMLAFLVACGGKSKPIDDPAMTQSGVALGQQSTTLAEMDPEADDGTVQANVQAVGGTLQGLVGQHSAYSQSNGLARSNPADRARQTSPEEPIYWDGTELCIDIEWAAVGATIDYQVELVYGTSGSDTTMDGRYDLVYDVGVAGLAYVYTVSAVYDQVTFSNGCAVGGSIIVDYDIQLDGGLGGIGDLAGQDQSGTVTVEYLGCDDVQISG
jgi:hypothetical protein